MICRERIRAASRAFVIHLLFSLLLITISAIIILGFWFPYPFRDLAGGWFLFGLLFGVDAICGPVLTALVFDPRKKRCELVFDLFLILVLQLGALIYGVYSISQARPVLLVFEVDRFVAVSAAQIDSDALPRAASKIGQSFSWNGPILIGTRAAKDGVEVLESIEMSLRGVEPSARPDWWQDYEVSRSSVILRMRKLEELHARQLLFSRTAIDAAVVDVGMPIEKIFYLPLVSQKSLDRWIVLLNMNADIIGYAPVDGF